jgi:hypothetical protein
VSGNGQVTLNNEENLKSEKLCTLKKKIFA